MDPVAAVILSVAGVLGATVLSPALIFAMYYRHKEKMARMHNRQEGAPGVVEDVALLRRELAALRETTTHFDMSFDAEIDKLQRRLAQLEAEQRAAVRGTNVGGGPVTMVGTPSAASVEPEAPQMLRRG